MGHIKIVFLLFPNWTYGMKQTLRAVSSALSTFRCWGLRVTLGWSAVTKHDMGPQIFRSKLGERLTHLGCYWSIQWALLAAMLPITPEVGGKCYRALNHQDAVRRGTLQFYTPCFSTQFVIPVKYPSLYYYALFFIVFYYIGSNFDAMSGLSFV